MATNNTTSTPPAYRLCCYINDSTPAPAYDGPDGPPSYQRFYENLNYRLQRRMNQRWRSLPLVKMSVRANMVDMVATVVITQVFANESETALDCEYH